MVQERWTRAAVLAVLAGGVVLFVLPMRTQDPPPTEQPRTVAPLSLRMSSATPRRPLQNTERPAARVRVVTIGSPQTPSAAGALTSSAAVTTRPAAQQAILARDRIAILANPRAATVAAAAAAAEAAEVAAELSVLREEPAGLELAERFQRIMAQHFPKQHMSEPDPQAPFPPPQCPAIPTGGGEVQPVLLGPRRSSALRQRSRRGLAAKPGEMDMSTTQATGRTNASLAAKGSKDHAYAGLQGDLEPSVMPTAIPSNQVTVVLMTYARGAHATALFSIRHFLRWSHLHEVVVVWNSGPAEVEPFARHLTATEWQRVRVVVFDRNSMTNRYDAEALQLRTDAVLLMDDDRTLPLTLANELLAHWTVRKDRLVGVLPRAFRASDSPNCPAFFRHIGMPFEYFSPIKFTAGVGGSAPIILPGAGAIVHRAFLCALSSPVLAPLRAFVDRHPAHPDDLLLNLVVLRLNGAKFPFRFHANNATSSPSSAFSARLAAERNFLNISLQAAEGAFSADVNGAQEDIPAGEVTSSTVPPAKTQLHSNDPWWFLVRSHGFSWMAEYLNLTATLHAHSSPMLSSAWRAREASKLFGVAPPDFALNSDLDAARSSRKGMAWRKESRSILDKLRKSARKEQEAQAGS